MDAILPTPTYRGQVVFYWSKTWPSTVREGPPEGTLGEKGWAAGPEPSGMEVDGGIRMLRVKPRATGMLSRCSPQSWGAALGVGFAAAWRKGSQGQCALEPGQGELGRLWGW